MQIQVYPLLILNQVGLILTHYFDFAVFSFTLNSTIRSIS